MEPIQPPLPPGLAELVSLNSPDKKSDYYVVTATDLEVKQFTTKQELQLYLRNQRDEELRTPIQNRAVIVAGNRVHLSKGEFKYILFPDGDKLPLFVEPSDIAPDESGYLIDPRPELEEVEVDSSADYIPEEPLVDDEPEDEFDN